MTHASLFSGIEGPGFAADLMGWENIFHCEINPFGRSVIEHHYPNSISYENIKNTDFTIHRGGVDVLTGGFPCQPYSTAGLRKGKEDERHLWPEMLRAIREIKPRWIVGENVLGLVSWNDGLVFEEVQTDLEAEGYEVQPYVLPAAAVGAPHRRDRVWFVAFNSECESDGRHYTGKSEGAELQMDGNQLDKAGWKESSNDIESSSIDAANTSSERHKRRSTSYWSQEDQAEWANLHYMLAGPGEEWPTSGTEKERVQGKEYRSKFFSGVVTNAAKERLQGSEASEFTCSNEQRCNKFNRGCHKLIDWEMFPTQSPVCTGNDGFSTESLRQRIREDSMGYLSEKEIDKILSTAYSQWRTETIKAGGNAIVHQVILQIFKAIEAYEESIKP